MGIVYQLPSLVDEKQLQSVVRILDATLPSSAQRGVVFYLGQTRNGPPPIDDVEKIVGGTIPKTYRRVFHLPFTSRYVDPRFRLDDPQSDQVLRPYLDLAHRLECKSVIVHTGTNYYHPQAILPAGTDPQYQWGNYVPPHPLPTSSRLVSGLNWLVVLEKEEGMSRIGYLRNGGEWID